MDTSSSEGWREQALRQMERSEQAEQAEQRELAQSPVVGQLGVMLLKVAILVPVSVALVIFLGYGWLFAVALVGWYLFWPR